MTLGILAFLFQNQIFPVDGDEEIDDDTPAVSLEKPAKDCDGQLYDTHTHLDNDGFAGQIAQRMIENKVGCSISFVSMDPDDLTESGEIFEEEFSNLPGRFVPFFHVNPQNPNDVDRTRLGRVLKEFPNQFKGFGETAFYRPPWIGQSLDTPNWAGVFELAAERDIFVMIHLRTDQLNQLSSMLKNHPQTKVLVHGPELRTSLPQLLKENTNLYFTLDTATIVSIGSGPGSILMYPDNMQKGNFVQKFDDNKETMLKDSLALWKDVIAAAPERVFWGTDVALPWHTDPDVYSRLIEFSNEFIAQLPAEQQRLFAYENAFKLFGAGVELFP